MNRRAFLAAAGGATLLPFAASAQPSAPPLIGVVRVNGRSAEQFEPVFRRDMARLGWEDGRNIRFDFLWADGRTERLPALAGELVARKASVLVAFGDIGIAAAQRAASGRPVVGMSGDLVGYGLVSSMAHPGGNVTGVSILGNELDVKRLELLHEFAPQARRIGVLADDTTTGQDSVAKLERAAVDLGLELVVVNAANAAALQPALDKLAAAKVGAVNVLASPFLNAVRAPMMERFRQARIAAIYEWPETAEEGGLIGYGPRITLCFRHVAVLVDKVLHGARPADLPIEQPTTFTLVINAATAKALDLPIPPSMLLRADAVVD